MTQCLLFGNHVNGNFMETYLFNDMQSLDCKLYRDHVRIFKNW